MKVDRLIKFELGRLNAHVPEKRLSLKEAVASARPQVVARSGGAHAFKREELKFLSGVVPEADWDKLQLPILIMLAPKLGRGAARIMAETEAKVARHILGRQGAGELIIYRPEIAAIRKKLPTTTQYVFTG